MIFPDQKCTPNRPRVQDYTVVVYLSGSRVKVHSNKLWRHTMQKKKYKKLQFIFKASLIESSLVVNGNTILVTRRCIMFVIRF